MNPELLIHLYTALASAADVLGADWDAVTRGDDPRVNTLRSLEAALVGIDPNGMKGVGGWAHISDRADADWYAACARSVASDLRSEADARAERRSRARDVVAEMRAKRRHKCAPK